MTTATKHLWEVDHDYYGADHCYYANSYQQADWNTDFESWIDFAGPEADSMFNFASDGLMGMNWLYRWDWQRPDPEDIDEDDDEYNGDTLELFFIFPRKGMFGKTSIKVTEEDEPAVRAYLQQWATYMRNMWAPFDLSPATS